MYECMAGEDLVYLKMYVDKDDLNLLILLPPPPCAGIREVYIAHPVYAGLQMEARASHRVDRRPAN